MFNKPILINNKSEHINSESYKQKEKIRVVVKKNEIIRPDINVTGSKIDICARGCNNNYFLSFKVICIYDIEMVKILIKN